MRLLIVILSSVVFFFLALLVYDATPKEYRYAMSDWYQRIGTPDFDFELDGDYSLLQSDVIREYERRGHDLKCYGNLQGKEKIGESDYVCILHAGSAYGGIPSRDASFHFSEERLKYVVVNFPVDSFDRLHNFLDKDLAPYPHVETDAQCADKACKYVKEWKLTDRTVTVNAGKKSLEKLVLFWSSNQPKKGSIKYKFDAGIPVYGKDVYLLAQSVNKFICEDASYQKTLGTTVKSCVENYERNEGRCSAKVFPDKEVVVPNDFWSGFLMTSFKKCISEG